jgi:hypothetical protein
MNFAATQTEEVGINVTVETHIRDLLFSNHSFPQSPHVNAPRLDHEHFLTNSFPFIIQDSFYHTTLSTLDTDKIVKQTKEKRQLNMLLYRDAWM